MSIALLFHWVQSTGWANALRESELVYPIVLSLHLCGIAFLGGAILFTNLRLLGVNLTNSTVAETVRQLRPWKWAGFVVIITCGILMASAKADSYYPNTYFRIKLLLLFLTGVHALAFRRSVYQTRSAILPRGARLAACLSLALWLGVLSMGRWIAYYEKPKTVSPPLTASGSAMEKVALQR